ncbi:hypothetical protein A9995_04995 [Erythrobacter sp. QSSC1-22B]|uniref:DUF6538 domain-containing protein n=1 Tax=Erythrobacter sp. QSSC1-22B TaxID=1860125 RepID=UPI0008054E34|nr:DUF6538 domain-containing protein [Erythrobacter sp. QSSC1-22B]OBX19909.1 hypothetical protein A9995_04995 [Erythrobacter sp. QSSC1-22B]
MRKQTYLIRKGARYHFRRRLPSYGSDNGAITLSLNTADPAEARRLTRRLAAPKRKTVSDVEQAILDRASQPPPPRPGDAEDATSPIVPDSAPPEETETVLVDEAAVMSVERIIEELAQQNGVTCRSPGTLFREFLTSCRQHGVTSANIDLVEFRRMFAFAVSGVGQLPAPARKSIEGLAEEVDEDVLAPYLAIAVAAFRGRTKPDENELARVYGSSSPGRIRRLLDHLERSGLINVRVDFAGERSIMVLRLEGTLAD